MIRSYLSGMVVAVVPTVGSAAYRHTTTPVSLILLPCRSCSRFFSGEWCSIQTYHCPYEPHIIMSVMLLPCISCCSFMLVNGAGCRHTTAPLSLIPCCYTMLYSFCRFLQVLLTVEALELEQLTALERFAVLSLLTYTASFMLWSSVSLELVNKPGQYSLLTYGMIFHLTSHFRHEWFCCVTFLVFDFYFFF